MTPRLVIALTLLAVLPQDALAQGRVQRFTLVAGANYGGAERARLKYAVSDAERFARVLVDLGGVSPADEILVKEATLRTFMQGLDRLSERVAQAKRTAAANGDRTEVLVYYSGHADEQGLLLGDDRYSYRSLRERLDQIPADVRIAVLDACASGAFTRLKSGKKRPAFLVDDASNMRGHAFLTSSASTESAQESDRIRASYFTHYLVSGFRGAADVSGDGRVTLNEAYQFAFAETLGRTVDSKGGPQHPSYDINLSGTGDVVMTDLRQTTGTLVLGEDLEGRFFVHNARRELIVELNKPRGREVLLAVEPGAYEIRLDAPRSALVAKAQVADQGRVVLAPEQFGRAALEPTVRRGDEERPDLSVAGRSRVTFRFGQWRQSSPDTGERWFEGAPAIEFTRYLSEDFAVVFAAQTMSVPGYTRPLMQVAVPGGTVTVPEVRHSSGTVLSLPVVLRWNPLTAGRQQRVIKPFLSGGVAPTFGWGQQASFTVPVFLDKYRKTALSMQFGGGVDFHLTERFAVGVNASYTAMVKGFSRPVGGRQNYSAPEIGFSVGWLFGGRGRK